MTTRRRAPPAQWPACLDWYNPTRYEIGTLHPMFWFSLLWQRMAVGQWIAAGHPRAREQLESLLRDPLGIVYLDFSTMQRPVRDVGFADIDRLQRLMKRPVLAREFLDWRTRERPLRAGRVGPLAFARAAPRAVPSLHDHLLNELASAPDDPELRSAVRTVVVEFDMALPHAERLAQADRVLREREQRLKLAGVRFGTAPGRGQSTAGHIGREQVESWAKLRVLDYIDIMLTCSLEGVPLPSAAAFGNKLFATDARLKGKGDGADLAERIRKYTAPEVDRITQFEFLEVFAAQMAALQADQEAKQS